MLIGDPKLRTEVRFYTINWSGDIHNDPIVRSTWEMGSGLNPHHMDIFESSFTRTETRVWLAGGHEGKHCLLTNTIETKYGYTYKKTLRVWCAG